MSGRPNSSEMTDSNSPAPTSAAENQAALWELARIIALLPPGPDNSPSDPEHTFELLKLPVEILYDIWFYLDPVTSTALGLSSQPLYHIHRIVNPVGAPLNLQSMDDGRYLYELLADWKPDHLWYRPQSHKWATIDNILRTLHRGGQ